MGSASSIIFIYRKLYDKTYKRALNYIGKDETDISPEDIFEDVDSTCINYDYGCSTSGIFELTPENCMTFIES